MLHGKPAFTVFDTEYCKIGIGICYDLRFAEYAAVLVRDYGCKVLAYPANFPIHTGTLHQDTQMRSRAFEFQAYVLGAAQARNTDMELNNQSYGNSVVYGPWGEKVAGAGIEEEIIYAEIDTETVDDVKTQLLWQTQKRSDMYQLKNNLA